VEPVGELDEDDAHVLRHRQQHLPDVLGLLLLEGGVVVQLGQLGDAVDEARDLLAEPLLDLGEAVVRVLGDVVQERRLDRGRVEAEVGHDLRRGDRVRHERLARCPLLVAVRLDREVECLLDERQRGIRVMPRHGFEQRHAHVVDRGRSGRRPDDLASRLGGLDCGRGSRPGRPVAGVPAASASPS
jgi:hypothetical protein